MNNKRELWIVQEEQLEWKKGEHEVWHPLYLDGYRAGLKNIFTKIYNMDVESEMHPNTAKNRFIRDEQNNILSFIGKRGSGKTTAMDEFCRILDGLENHEESKWWLNETVGKDISEQLRSRRFKFHILQPIDASLFDESRDLFEQIIANLYRYFHDENKKEYKEGSDYMGMYSEIMKRYYSSKIDKSNKGSAFSIANMINFASDNNEIQEKIINLIDCYLNGNGKIDYEYIVITIDDIDLNIGQGYKMLEQIQKYFAYHKIIILVSMDYDQMRMVCEKHFWESLGDDNRINSEKYNKQYIRNLTKDVMTKIFHISQRIYLPDLSAILKTTYVLEDKKMSIKGYIIKKIVDKLHIYYDLCGKKRHFVEPETIREFVVYIEFLETLNDVDITQMSDNFEKVMSMYDSNSKSFINDIVERMAQNLLTAEQLVAFRKLQSRDVERRAKYFVYSDIDEDGNIIFANIDEPTTGKTSRINKIRKVLKEQEYSYGDLLEQIYLWGRLPDRDCFEDKPYIWSVLAMFTTDMTERYIHYKYSIDNEGKTKYKKQLLSFIGESVGSEWLKAAFPKIPYNGGETSSKPDKNLICFGYDKNPTLGELTIRIPEEMMNINNVGITELKSCIEKSGIIQTMAVIDMCFSKIVNGEVKRIEFTLKNIDDIYFIGVKENCYVNLDMMSFVLKSFDYIECQEELINNIRAVILELVDKMLYKPDNIEIEEWDNLIKEALPFDYIEDDLEDIAFPFYDLDLSYNVLKRVRKEFNNSNAANDLPTAMKMFYGKIANLLKEEDDEYSILGVEKDYFSNKYKKFPFINALLDEKNEKNKKNVDIINAISKFEYVLKNKMTLSPGGDAGVLPKPQEE